MKLKIKILLNLIIISQILLIGNISAQAHHGELQQMQKELQQLQKEIDQLLDQKNNDLYTPQKRQTTKRTDTPKVIIEENIPIQEDTYSEQDSGTNIDTDAYKVIDTKYARKWTLEECIQYAIKNNIDIQKLNNQRKIAEIEQSTAKNSRLPDLTAGLIQDWTFGRSQTYPDLDEPLSRTAAGATSSIPIFTGFRIPNEIARAKLEFEAATQNLEKAKDNLSLNVTSLFLQVLFNKELVKINEEQLAYTRIQITKTKILIESGSVPPANLYDIQAQLAKEMVSLIEAKNNLELALLDLVQALELEKEKSFDIKTPSFSDNALTQMFSSIQHAQSIYDNAVSFKPVIKEQEYRVESAKKTLKIAKSEYMPNLNLVFEMGTGYLYKYDAEDRIDPITNQTIRGNASFSDQLKNNDFILIGLKLNIPIFNRFQTRNKVRTARLDILNQELELDNIKKILYKEIQTAYKNAVSSYEKYKASDEAVKSSSESFRHAQIRYDLAKMTPFEYNEAKTKYIQSQYEKVQAKYDYILRTKILDFYNGIPIRL